MMKALGIAFFIAVCLLHSPCRAGQGGFCVVSPDRPVVWYNRSGDEIGKELAWNNSKQKLEVYVAYSNTAYTSNHDQTLYDRFRLSFPTVRLEGATGRLYVRDEKGRENEIGHLRSGFLGSRVVLDKNVRVSVHRKNGVVTAALVSGEGDFNG